MAAAAAAAAALVALLATASAQPVTGNHENGMDYQPSPNEVLPRERAAGIRPPKASREQTDRALGQLDRSLLRSEGLDPATAPDLMPRH